MGLVRGILSILLLSLGCARRDHRMLCENAFLQGQGDNVIALAQEWLEKQPGTVLPNFALSVAYYLAADFTKTAHYRKQAFGSSGPDEELRTWVRGLLEKAPRSPWAQVAFAIVAEQDGDVAVAAEHYSKAAELDPNNLLLRYVMQIPSTAGVQTPPRRTVKATLHGTMRPADGPWGRVLPLPKETQVKGSVESVLGGLRCHAAVDDWAYLYANKSSETPLGWGVRIGEGQVIVSGDEYADIAAGQISCCAQQQFEVRPFDYSGRYVLLQASRNAPPGIVVPIQIHESAPGPSETRTEVKTPATINVSGRLYRNDNGANVFAGMTIDGKGRRIGINTQYMRISLDDTCYVEGEFGCISLR